MEDRKKTRGFTTIVRVLVFFTLVYCFSIHSYQALIPAPLRIVFLLGMPVGISLVVIFFRLSSAKKIRKSLVVFSSVLMILIMLLWNNHTIHAEGVLGMYGQIMPILFFIAIYKSSNWYDELLNLMIIMGLFYAVWTVICLVIPNVYYSGIAPLMKSLYPQTSYDVDAKAGFTAHYSTNGMYLANGVIASLTKYLLNRNENVSKRGKNRLLLVNLVFQFAAFLICGKRGTLLCLILGCYITYFVYESNKPKGRLFKIILFSFIMVVVIYLASLIVPALANVYLRMITMISRDDVSTGRFDLWAAGWRGFLSSPIVGHGWRWFYYYDKSVFAYHDIHNVYLQFLTELGIIGSIPFYLFFFVSLFHTIKLLKEWRFSGGKDIQHGKYLVFCLLYQSFFLIFIFEGTAFYNPEALIPFCASCAMTENIYLINKKNIRRKLIWA